MSNTKMYYSSKAEHNRVFAKRLTVHILRGTLGHLDSLGGFSCDGFGLHNKACNITVYQV